MGQKFNKTGNPTFLRKTFREMQKDDILAFLATGDKVTEEIRRHLWCEYYRAGLLLRELRAEGKIQSARAPTQRANQQKKWRLTPVAPPSDQSGD